jgi:catechol 2,3-dioxygenase-like lactoylglutathione lyase family enzyme
MRLNHLALAVRDQERSRFFYETYFGFGDGPPQLYEDGVFMLRDAQGFDLALARVSAPGPLPDCVHIGFRALYPQDVRALAEQLTAD